MVPVLKFLVKHVAGYLVPKMIVKRSGPNLSSKNPAVKESTDNDPYFN